MRPELARAKQLAESEPDEALRICNDIINEEIDTKDAQIALFMSGYLMMQAERYGLAYHIFKRCAELNPNQAEIYINMGMCLDNERPYEAIKCFEQAIKLKPNLPNAIANKALMCLQTGRPEQCITLSNLALRQDPTLKSAIHNRGLAKLMLRDFSGWKEYYETLGVKHREKRDYGVPDWNGEPGTVLVYGEQGVGDEIMFASCLNDLSKTNSVILDCDSRLESIFKRNFDFPVYGTRYKKQTPIIDNHEFDYQCAIGQLPYFYRRKEDEYPGDPYIKPCPERVKQWGVLLDSGRPKIGIAWRGGLLTTGENVRSTEFDVFKKLLDLDADFVNLEYKPVNSEEMAANNVKNWPRAVIKGCDLEDTLALISNLDVVVTVCTTVVYLAGCMGKPCYVLVPETPGYRYHKKGDSFPWYSSVKLFRGKFESSINRIKNDIINNFVEGDFKRGVAC